MLNSIVRTFVRNNIRSGFLSLQRFCTKADSLLFNDSSEWCDKLEFISPENFSKFPMYKVLDKNGTLLLPDAEPLVSSQDLVKMYQNMTYLTVMDRILYDAQRQGRISFYMTSYGEEAAVIGSAAGLTSEDIVYGQYREYGVLLWRGFQAQEFIDQCYGNIGDKSKGRQMPVHYGSRKLNFVTISSPLGTQIPQAVGAAYAIRNTENAVICYFGEGAASEGDAYVAFNFAATLGCPVIFFCRNNGYAISTSIREQYKGDGIASRGPGMGIHTLRVDGCDVLAVYNAVKKAKEFTVKMKKPVLIEAMCYRIGHHSTSDDSTVYRPQSEVDSWLTRNNPITRYKIYLINKGLWTEEQDKEWLLRARKEFLEAFQKGEKKLKPKWTELFNDVYHDIPPHLQKQMEYMKSHVSQYSENYPVSEFTKIN